MSIQKFPLKLVLYIYKIPRIMQIITSENIVGRAEFIQRFGYIVAFLATHSGLTRWQTHPPKENSSENDKWENISMTVYNSGLSQKHPLHQEDGLKILSRACPAKMIYRRSNHSTSPRCPVIILTNRKLGITFKIKFCVFWTNLSNK